MTFSLFLQALELTFGLMSLVWVLSLILRNAAIVDVFWGLGFALVSTVMITGATNPSTRAWTLTFLIWIWAVRLTIHLAIRNIGKPEDPRYVSIRRKIGPSFPIVSLFVVFWLQAAIMAVVGLPLWAGIDTAGGLNGPSLLGIMIWSIGFYFEAVGDWQLARFKANPENHGKILDYGLWKWTRHPNYFGDAAIWWGVYLIALGDGADWWTAIGPLLMTILLVWVSGVRLTENRMQGRSDAYREYIARTSSFLPWPPRSRKENEACNIL